MHRFDAQARLVFHYAAEESRRLGHSRIAPEHLLLGTLRFEHAAVEVLGQMGLGIIQARHKLEDKLGKREPIPANRIPEVSQAAVSCMEAAAAEARRLQAEQIGVGHVLLGIIRTAEASSRQMTGGILLAQILGELEGGVRGVLRRVLESLRQPTPALMGLQLEPKPKVAVALLLEAETHSTLLETAKRFGMSAEALATQWLEERVKGLR
jgi:ATP-dependent Clp protease ATP-binding subunit ClpA